MAASIERHRFLEADVAAFEPPHDRFKLAHRGFERERGDIGRRCAVGDVRHAPCFGPRSEEHTSELQSLMRISYAVFCLQKKIQKKKNPDHITDNTQNTNSL